MILDPLKWSIVIGIHETEILIKKESWKMITESLLSHNIDYIMITK